MPWKDSREPLMLFLRVLLLELSRGCRALLKKDASDLQNVALKLRSPAEAMVLQTLT